MSLFRPRRRLCISSILLLVVTSVWGIDSETAYGDDIVADLISKFRNAADWYFVYSVDEIGPAADGVIQKVIDGDGDIVGLGQPIQFGDVVSEAAMDLPRFQFIYAARSKNVDIVLLYRQGYIAGTLLSVYVVDNVTGAYCVYTTDRLGQVPTVIALQRYLSARENDAECRPGYRAGNVVSEGES